jgi:formylglycine-generating enzyme required for sulfatase activity
VYLYSTESDQDSLFCSWPSLSSILDFRLRVRARTLKLYDEIERGQRPLTRKVARVLHMTHEHEIMHAETLLYMLLQSSNPGSPISTIPPPDFTPPNWASLAEQWAAAPPPSTPYAEFGKTTVVLGHGDVESEDVTKESEVDGHEFGWDNESPRREVEVQPFKIDWRPVTNGQFFEFWQTRKDTVKMPKSWIQAEGAVQVLAFSSACEDQNGVLIRRNSLGPHALRPRPLLDRAGMARDHRPRRPLNVCARAWRSPPDRGRAPLVPG